MGFASNLLGLRIVGWNFGFLNKDGHIVGGYGGIVHSCPIVVYFTSFILHSWTLNIEILAVNRLKNSGIGLPGRGPLRENP